MNAIRRVRICRQPQTLVALIAIFIFFYPALSQCFQDTSSPDSTIIDSTGVDSAADAVEFPEEQNPVFSLPYLAHFEGGVGGFIANSRHATQHAEGLLLLSGQIPLSVVPAWIDFSFNGSLPIAKTDDDNLTEEFTFLGIYAGLGKTWVGRNLDWYYCIGGGMSYHFADLRIGPHSDEETPTYDQQDASHLFGAYLRGNLMFKVMEIEKASIFCGLGVMGEGTTTSHILNRRLNNNGISIGLFAGISGF